LQPRRRLTRQRRDIIASLQKLALSGDKGYGTAVDKTDELRRNMAQEVRCPHLPGSMHYD